MNLKGWPSGSRRGSGRCGCGLQILADCCFHHVLGPASSPDEAPAPAGSMSTVAPSPAPAGAVACFTYQCLSIAKKDLGGPATAPEGAPESAESMSRDAPAGAAAGAVARFTYHCLSIATNNFDKRLGGGGCGSVFLFEECWCRGLELL